VYQKTLNILSLAMTGTTAAKTRVSLREMFSGFPIALTIYYATVVVFTVFNLGSYFVAKTSQSLFTAWLDFSKPFTNWVAGSFPFVVESITRHLQRTHSPQLIPIHTNVFLIDFVLMIVLSGASLLVYLLMFGLIPKRPLFAQSILRQDLRR
jgi:hypothetical protein